MHFVCMNIEAMLGHYGNVKFPTFLAHNAKGHYSKIRWSHNTSRDSSNLQRVTITLDEQAAAHKSRKIQYAKSRLNLIGGVVLFGYAL